MQIKALKLTTVENYWAFRQAQTDPSRVYRIMADHGGYYLWRSGDMAPLYDCFPGIDGLWELERRLMAWQSTYEDMQTGTAVAMNWQAFHSAGIELAGEIKAVLGDRIIVIYEKPLADPNHAEDELRLVELQDAV